MNQFVFSCVAEKKFKKFPLQVQEYLLEKLREYKNREDFLKLLKKLQGFDPATHRLRAGNYRFILEHLAEGKWLILDMADRKDIYR